MFISGASRGIGLAIAKRAAADGANIALIAKTAKLHPKLPGTVYTAAQEIEEAGGHALPIVGDIRDSDAVDAAVVRAVEQFGGIDICVNNASALNTGSVQDISMKQFDLMNGIQVRGTFAVSRACLPHMRGRENPHILTMAPPIRLHPQKWLAPTAYTMAKFGMSLCALGLAEELRSDGIASNTLWPRTSVATAAIRNLRGEEPLRQSRKPEVCSDAAYEIVTRPSRECTGLSLLCEDVLLEAGVTDLSVYDYTPGYQLRVDMWVDSANPPGYIAP
jgi:citronellol/citronellal dehydrogenase